MKPYPTYKDSGIEWIGKIPEHWNIVNLKFIANIYNGNSLKDELKTLYKSHSKNLRPYISTKDINTNTLKINFNNALRIPKEVEDKYRLADEGSFLLCIEGGSAGKKIAYVSQSTFFVNKLACINSGSKFLYYFAQSNFFKNQFKQNLSGLISGVSISNLKNFNGLNLPSVEQTQIANYLDKKTAQIDSLIAKKENLIQLLEEEKTALINQAVTKGLDPNVKMKDSGIEWLGKIPEHWEVKKLRYLGKLQNGISAGADFFGKGHPFLSYSDVYNNKILPSNPKGLANSIESQQKIYSVKENDIFFTRTSETIEEIGIASVCLKTIQNATFAGFLIRFRPNNQTIDKQFSKYFFNSIVPRVFFVKEMNIVTRASLSQELLKRLPVLLPSLEEQKKISNFLDSKTCSIENTISKSGKEIELLKEYKTTLISEVVTGKIDVRDKV